MANWGETVRIVHPDVQPRPVPQRNFREAVQPAGELRPRQVSANIPGNTPKDGVAWLFNTW